MKILFFGASNFAVNKVIPEVLESKIFSRVAVASRSSERSSNLSSEVLLFQDYQLALKEFPADIVYVSTVNSEHYRLSKMALEAGKHVLVDKPATTSYSQSKELVGIARDHHLLISEALFYEYHPQITELKHLISSSARIQYVSAIFSVPTFTQDNFRYNEKLGGGVFYDMGPYAVSLARVLLGEDIEDMVVKTTEGTSESLPLAFSMTLTLSSGAVLSGYFGFNSEYTNRVEVLGEDMRVAVERIFTIPPDYENTYRLVQTNSFEDVSLPVGSSIQRYFSEIVASVGNKDHSRFSDILMKDAEHLHRLQSATQGLIR